MSALPRRTGVASLTALAACAVAFIAIDLLAPQWVQAEGFDFWQYHEDVSGYHRECERQQDLTDIQTRIAEQIGAGDAVVDVLIEGRITLAAAIDQIAEINSDRPGFTEVMIYIHSSARTHHERIEQYILAKIRSRLAADPTRLAEVLGRFEAEARGAAAHQ